MLVTGSTAGIGKATALGLARLGAHVAITCDSLGIDTWQLRQHAGQLATAHPDVDQGTFAEPDIPER